MNIDRSVLSLDLEEASGLAELYMSSAEIEALDSFTRMFVRKRADEGSKMTLEEDVVIEQLFERVPGSRDAFQKLTRLTVYFRDSKNAQTIVKN